MEQRRKKKKLFSEFPPVPTTEWEELIRKDLKGADYEKKLTWKTPEGFTVKPYYRQEDLAALEWMKDLSSVYPVDGGSRKTGKWIIRQDFTTTDIKEANTFALEAIARGVEDVGLCRQEPARHPAVV